MKKIVIHVDYGLFNLSAIGQTVYAQLSKADLNDFFATDLKRDDPFLVQTVEMLGKMAGENLKIVEVPDDVKFEICDYDGKEWVAEKHRVWF